MSVETTKIVKSNINNCIPKSTGEKIKEIRSITGLSQAKFSNEYHIPLKTVGTELCKMPGLCNRAFRV